MTVDGLPRAADCVIIGGGVVGCSLAFHLAQAGLEPLLLERGEFGAGSTARCAGGVRQQFSTSINVRVGMLSRRLLERFEDEVGTTADFRQIGYLLLATSEQQLAQFRENLAVQRDAGLDDVRLLTPAEVAVLVPELNVADVTGGTFCPSDGLAGPNEVTAGYVRGARRLGARVHENAPVTAVIAGVAGIEGVEVNGERVSSPLVVNCAGPHAGAVGELAGVVVPVTPYRRHLFLTETFALRGNPPFTVDMSSSFYFHPEGDGLLLGMSDPAEPSSFDTSVDWTFLEHLVEHATHRLPVLDRAAIRTGWAGLYEVSPDNQAIVGESELPGFWLCCGFSGHGFMQAPAIGRVLAQQITGADVDIDLSAFRPSRFGGGGTVVETAVI